MTKKKTRKDRMWLIDPIYKKFTTQAFKNLTSKEFYDYFMSMISNGDQVFQFSNKHLDMQIDESWVKIIEDTIPALIEIAKDPRVIITQEELITNVVQVRSFGSQVIRHLLSHSYLIEAWDKEKDEVRPNKLLNIVEEETWDTYENRFVYTLLEKTYAFVDKRYRDMKDMIGDDFGANLRIKSQGVSKMEHFWVDSTMKIVQKDEFFDSDDPNSVYARIRKIYEDLVGLMSTRFAKEMQKYSKVAPPLVPTNAIKKHPYLKACHKLWDFIWAYYDVGYTVEVVEQSPDVDEKLQQDIFNNIAFTYIILKGHLENTRERMMDRNAKAQRRKIKPKYIKEIIEEFVESFDLPDVEVRKILVEELTKEDLMREEREERYRLVEEKKKADERRKREEEALRLKKIREAEKAAERKAREKERIRQQKEKEKLRKAERKAKEKERIRARDERNAVLYQKELSQALEAVAKRRERSRSMSENNEGDTQGETG